MLRKISHLTLIFLLLVSTVGLSINLHYCNNNIYDIGVFSEAISCCSVDANKHLNKELHHNCEMNSHKNDCEDETLKIESLDNYITSSNDININNESFVNLFIVSAFVTDVLNLSHITSEEVPIYNISPPKIQVILALFQSYLL